MHLKDLEKEKLVKSITDKMKEETKIDAEMNN
jgi:hypothetical protein